MFSHVIVSETTDRRRSYISRLSIASDMISEDQIHNNEIFSPRPVLHTSRES